jgi:toxin-antitoxin system PIN domain toxin
MSFTVDANLLLYASDLSSPRQPKAYENLSRLARGPAIAYLFWPVLMAYLRISTHSSIFSAPLSAEEAMENVSALVALPNVRCPGESAGFWDVYEHIAAGQNIRGNLVPDAHIVALMRQHGATVIWTDDRDFRRFDGITVRLLDDLV